MAGAVTSAAPVTLKDIMIYAFIRGILGTSGDIILDFYIANGLWINTLILLYGVLVMLARRSFILCQQLLVSSILSQYSQQFERKKTSSILKILQGASMPWEQALKTSIFPFVAPPGSIRIYPKNLRTLQRLMPLEKLAELLTKSRVTKAS